MRTIRSVTIKEEVKDLDNPFELEERLPRTVFQAKYCFDGNDIGPFCDDEDAKQEPLVLKLYWYPKNKARADELILLLEGLGFTPEYDEYKIPRSRSAFTAKD